MRRSDDVERRRHEVAHGKAIAARADRVWLRDTEAGVRRVENRFSDFQRFVGREARGRVLEIGCGTGAWTRCLVRTSLSVTSIELSQDLLAVAAKGQGPDAPRVRYACGDGEHLPFADASFEVVSGLSILHHLALEPALSEAFRVLRPGGKAWFSEPNMLNPQIALQKNIPVLKRWAGDTPDETAYFRWSLQRSFRRAGFSRVGVSPSDFLHPAIPAIAARAMDWTGRQLERIPGLREIAGSLIVHAEK
jgi:SAM-dependent methyltransferase